MNEAEEALYQFYKSQKELVEYALTKIDKLSQPFKELIYGVKEANDTLEIGRPIYKERYDKEKQNGNTTNSESYCGRGTQYH